MKERRKSNGGLKWVHREREGGKAIQLFVLHVSPVGGDCPCGKRLWYHQRADTYCTTTTPSRACCISTSLISLFFSWSLFFWKNVLIVCRLVCAAAREIDPIPLRINFISWCAIVCDVFQLPHTHALSLSSLPALTLSQSGSLDLPSPTQITFHYYHSPLNFHERIRRPEVKGPAVFFVV